MKAACALLPLQEDVRGEGRRINILFFLFWFFLLLLLNSVSPVLCLECELRPLVHFDGVICCLLSAMMYLFLGRGREGRDCYAGRVISLVYRVNMLFIADFIIYWGGCMGPEEQQRPVDFRGRDDLPDGWH